MSHLFLLMLRPPPTTTLFPYTTLFRSCCCPTWARPPSRAAWTWARRSSSTSRPSATAINRPTACWRRCSRARRSLDFHRAVSHPAPTRPVVEAAQQIVEIGDGVLQPVLEG